MGGSVCPCLRGPVVPSLCRSAAAASPARCLLPERSVALGGSRLPRRFVLLYSVGAHSESGLLRLHPALADSSATKRVLCSSWSSQSRGAISALDFGSLIITSKRPCRPAALGNHCSTLSDQWSHAIGALLGLWGFFSPSKIVTRRVHVEPHTASVLLQAA